MLSESQLASIVEFVAEEEDVDTVLDHLAQEALEATRSRNVMFARMNDQEGSVELTNGAGVDWTPAARGFKFPIGDKEGGGIVAFVAAKGKRFRSGNVQEERFYRNLFANSRSELAVPILDRHQRIRAVLNLESDQENYYDSQVESLVDFFAGLAGLVLSRDQRLRREKALVQIGAGLDLAVTEDELIDRILEVAETVLQFQSSSIFLYDPTQELYLLRGSTGPLKEQAGKVGYKPGEGCTGWVAQNDQPLRLDRPQESPYWVGKCLEIPQDEIASYLAVPIDNRGKVIGVLRVIRRVGDNPSQINSFTEDDERILMAIAEQFATGLENLRSAQKAIQIERMAAWGELSAKSSHMIGNRVFAVRGDVNELGHLLNEQPIDMEQLKLIQKSLVTNLTRVEEILQEFRDFVMATEFSRVHVDLNELVKEAVTEVFPRRSTVKLVYDLSPNLPHVYADPRKLTRAITEIVENALSFFDEGSLRVCTGQANDELKRRAKLPLRRAYCVVEIEDEGPGVDPERKQIIFQPFHSSRVKGMGLGLSIVKGILEGHGGTVFEEGQPGKGARFVMLIPVAERP